jgi:uncharacterized protein YegJ (DUF2314 family)
MKTLRCALALLSLALLLCSCGRDPETLVRGGYDEKEMDAAIARARAEVDVFIVALEKSAGTDFAVKAPIKDGDQVEHFWLTDVTFHDGAFAGLIGNDPGTVRNVKFGQQWKLKKLEISDWMFMQDGKMHGNYTMRPLLKAMDKAEAARWRTLLADP